MSAVGFSFTFQISLVDESRLSSDTVVTEERAMTTKISAALRCIHSPTCECLCVLPNNTYAFTDLVVTGNIADTMAGNLLECFTKRPAGYRLSPAAGVTITASPVSPDIPGRVQENMYDGIYGGNIDECYYSRTANAYNYKYFVVDFGYSVDIAYVSVRIQTIGNQTTKFDVVNIYVSDTFPDLDSDFSSLPLFASVNNPNHALDSDVVFFPGYTAYGRYLSIVKTSVGAICFCHLEISN